MGYNIGSLPFATKKAAKKFVSDWLAGHEEGYACSFDEMEAWILPLLRAHCEYDEKMAGWNGNITVRKNGDYNNFFLEKDPPAQSCTISTRVCFDPSVASHKSDVKAAFREAIDDQSERTSAKTFADALQRFLDENKLTYDDIAIKKNRMAHMTKNRIEDDGLKCAWIAFYTGRS